MIGDKLWSSCPARRELFKKGQEFGRNKIPYKKVIFDAISNNKATVKITNITIGTYAFLVFHDENNDAVFATNWIGIPKEGVGKSGEQGTRPNYENSKFFFSGGQMKFDIMLKYLL